MSGQEPESVDVPETKNPPPPPSEDDEASGGKRSRWMSHVMKTKRAHKGKSLKQVLKMASKSYKGGSALTPAPANGQTAGRRRRSTRKSRKGKKGSRKH